MARAFLALGSNQGERLETLSRAVALLQEQGVRPLRASSVYETAPVGYTAQPAFLNAVLEVATDLPPAELLAAIQAVERAAGRVRTLRWGPRTLDIDVLLYEDLRLDTPELQIPHPRMTQRRFVLLPLLEIDPDCVIPGVGPARACLDALDPNDQPATRVGPLQTG